MAVLAHLQVQRHICSPAFFCFRNGDVLDVQVIEKLPVEDEEVEEGCGINQSIKMEHDPHRRLVPVADRSVQQFRACSWQVSTAVQSLQLTCQYSSSEPAADRSVQQFRACTWQVSTAVQSLQLTAVLRSRIVLIRIRILVPYFNNLDSDPDPAINFLNNLIFDCSKINFFSLKQFFLYRVL